MCVGVPGGTTAPGAPLQLYHCHGYASDGAPQLAAGWRDG